MFLTVEMLRSPFDCFTLRKGTSTLPFNFLHSTIQIQVKYIPHDFENKCFRITNSIIKEEIKVHLQKSIRSIILHYKQKSLQSYLQYSILMIISLEIRNKANNRNDNVKLCIQSIVNLDSKLYLNITC